ncbi:MAG: hypothetical protein K0S32_926 [Bacteroidetes bacterium]|jgi:uncharacterized membrane protein YqjE|nr:hypothetical protein [Bacteroidota bacterium]
MEEEKKSEGGKMEKLISNVVECAETRFDLVAIDVQDKVSDILASIASIAIFGIMVAFALLLLSVGTAMYLAYYFDSFFKGFCVVGVFYLVVGSVLYIKRKDWIRLPIINAVLKKINFHEED